ncbi:MAG: MFS transporter, partial [Oscillospiraceae bacterium]|nr:MFS transporter [Oscillospiraceae bacterium]
MFSIFMLLSMHLLYQNPIYTGVAAFLMAAPHVFSFAAGPIVDRRNKVSIMRLTTLLEFSVLALLSLSPLQEYLGVMFMFSVVLAFSMSALFEVPAGTALLPQLVQEEKIMEANSLIQIVSLVGGVTIAAVLFYHLGGEPDHRFIYGLSAAFVALAFVASLFLKDPAVKTKEGEPPPSYLQDLKDGAKFIRRSILLYTTIAVVALSLFAEITIVNRPMFFEYHVGAQGYVVFVVMALIGGIIASAFVGALGKRFRVGQFIFMALIIASVVRIAFVLVLPVQFAGGIALMILYSTLAISSGLVFTSLRQKIPPKDMVGRVDTISRTFEALFVTIGALAGGFLGSVVPVVDYIFIFQAVAYAVIALFLILVPSIRKLPKINEIKKADNGADETAF